VPKSAARDRPRLAEAGLDVFEQVLLDRLQVAELRNHNLRQNGYTTGTNQHRSAVKNA
jgi:hypothetical protein